MDYKGMDYDDFDGATSEDEYVPHGPDFTEYPTCFRELVDVDGLNTVWVNESDFIDAWDRLIDFDEGDTEEVMDTSTSTMEMAGLKASVKAAEHFMPPNVKVGSARLYCEDTLLDVMSGFSSFNTR